MNRSQARTEVLRQKNEAKRARRADRRARWEARHGRAWTPGQPDARKARRTWSLRGLRSDRGPGKVRAAAQTLLRTLGELALEEGMSRRDGIELGLQLVRERLSGGDDAKVSTTLRGGYALAALTVEGAGTPRANPTSE